VVGPLVGLVGSLQALEALKLLAGFGEPLVGRLLLIDALTTRFRELRVKRDPGCSVVGRSMRDAPIGVFDSGVGGLSVLAEIQRLLPHESLLYVADCGHIPYGEKTPEFIRQRLHRVAGFFREQGAKALVIACNTATVAAVADLRRITRLAAGRHGAGGQTRRCRDPQWRGRRARHHRHPAERQVRRVARSFRHRCA
jgi:glutamate racemase